MTFREGPRASAAARNRGKPNIIEILNSQREGWSKIQLAPRPAFARVKNAPSQENFVVRDKEIILF